MRPGYFPFPCLFGLVFLLSACAFVITSTTGAPSYHDVTFHLVDTMPSPDYRPALDRSGQPPYLRAQPAITSADIREVRNTDADGMPTIEIDFQPETHGRIRCFTTENIGKRVSLLSGDNLLTTATVIAPFDKSMRLMGVSPEQRDQYFTVLTQGLPRRLDNPPAGD